jgi:hypothetical protein
VRWIGLDRLRSVGNRAALFFATPLTFALASIGVFTHAALAFLFGAIGSLLLASATSRPASNTRLALLALAGDQRTVFSQRCSLR